MGHTDSLFALSRLIERGMVSPLTLMERLIERLECSPEERACFATIATEHALRMAEQAEREIQQGLYRGPLHGIPVTVKDLIETKALPTRYGMKGEFTRNNRINAAVVEDLEQAGAIVLGKTRTTEAGSAAYHDNDDPVKNPWDPALWTGVSSAGSAAATALGIGLASIGTDTGGSVRGPAACTGLVGLKPSFGSLSCEGVLPFSPSLDHVGMFTKSAGDGSLLWRVLGKDASVDSHFKHPSEIVIGIDYDFCLSNIDSDTQKHFEETLRVFEQVGFSLEEITINAYEGLAKQWLMLASYEAFQTHLARFNQETVNYGSAFKGLLFYGKSISQEEIVPLIEAKSRLKHEVNELFSKIAALFCPIFPIANPKADYQFKVSQLEHQLKFLVPFNMSGHPAVSFPCGFGQSSGPIGMQLVGAFHRELEILQIVEEYQRLTHWHRRRPRGFG